MFIHPNRYRSQWAHRQGDLESDSLGAVCGLSLIGLTTSLIIVEPAAVVAAVSRVVVELLGCGIVAAAIRAALHAAGRSDG